MKSECKILLVDDDLDLCANIQEILEENNYSVASAYNGKSAIELSKKNEYDLSIIDINLPDIPGTEVVDEIYRHSAKIEFIYMTGQASLDSTIVALSQKNIISYQTKPVNINHLLTNINQIYKRKLAEENAQRSGKRLLRAQNVTKMGFIDWDLITNEIYCSDEIFQLYGIDPEKAKPTLDMLLELIYPDDLEFVQENLNRAIHDLSVYDIDHRILRPDGKVIWVHAQGELELDRNGNPVTLLGTLVEITMRKQANLERNRIFDMPMILIMVINSEAKIVRVSEGWKDVLDYSSDEMIGKSFLDFIHPEDIPKSHSWVEDLAEGNVGKFFENRYLHKDGTCRTLAWTVSVNLETDLYYSIAQDITERKLVEKKLIESEVKFRSAMQNSPIGMALVAPDGQWLEVNNALCNIVGYSADELCAFDFQRLTHPDDLGKDLDFVRQMLDREIDNYQMEKRYFHKDGSVVWVLLSVSLMWDDEDNPIYFIAQIKDISNRKHAEQIQNILYNISNAVNIKGNLKKLIGFIRKELGIIIDTTNFYVVLYDAITDMLSIPFFVDEKDRFKSIPAGKTLTRYVLNKKKSLLANEEKLKALHQAGSIERFGSNPKIWLGVPLKVKGKIIGILAVQSYTDKNAYNELDVKLLEFVSAQISISIHRKKTEEDLIAALIKAQESDRLKSAFLANMSHEIRTPMNGILGFADLLKTPGIDGEKQQEYISVIEKSGARMLKTINNLVDISRIEAEQIDVYISEVNINEQIEELYSFFKPEAEKKGLQFYFKNTLHAQEAIIKTDKEKTHSILTNLVANAFKYTNEGSIEFGCYKKGDTIEFYVKDTGIGIPKNRQKAIFDRFVQADIEDKEVYEGSGLGLSISKAYAEMLDGEIWVESNIEDLSNGKTRGSQFYFTIPHNVKTEEKTSSEASVSKELNKSQTPRLKILIADDEEIIRNHLTVLVESFSKEILYANNGLEAVELCRKHPDIDLILMDVKMPRINGHEATKQIREFNKEVIIISQTAYALVGDKEKSLEAGCNDYISKPIKKDELMKIIRDHLN